MKDPLRIVMGVALTCSAAVCLAQSSPRAGKRGFMLLPQFSESWSASGNSGTRVDVEEAWGFGFGCSFNGHRLQVLTAGSRVAP